MGDSRANGTSQFLYNVDTDSLTLDAAAYVDKMGLCILLRGTEMIDLTPIFDTALERKKFYCDNIALRVMNELVSAISGATLDWDMENEDWGRILLEQKEVAFVSSLVPICLTEERLRSSIEPSLQKNGVLGVYANRLSDENFTIDPIKLRDIFGLDVTNWVNWQRISLHDIWFSTV